MTKPHLRFLLVIVALVGLRVSRLVVQPMPIHGIHAASPLTLYTVFDPDALVIIDPGPDGLPGRANVDDGGNGVVDERSELGATGSDDVCRVVFGSDAASFKQQMDNPPAVIAQRGAFRPLQNSAQEDRISKSPAGQDTRLLSRRHVRWVDQAGRIRERMEVVKVDQ
jgi:hypothetical protein